MTKGILQSDIDYAKQLLGTGVGDEKVAAALCLRGIEAPRAAQLVQDLRSGVPVGPEPVPMPSMNVKRHHRSHSSHRSHKEKSSSPLMALVAAVVVVALLGCAGAYLYKQFTAAKPATPESTGGGSAATNRSR